MAEKVHDYQYDVDDFQHPKYTFYHWIANAKPVCPRSL